ncbi:MAG: type II secretion system protein [Anaerolineales bacterium]|nr:type II secretion system protein [Anaerolineales bacterium]
MQNATLSASSARNKPPTAQLANQKPSIVSLTASTGMRPRTLDTVWRIVPTDTERLERINVKVARSLGGQGVVLAHRMRGVWSASMVTIRMKRIRVLRVMCRVRRVRRVLRHV